MRSLLVALGFLTVIPVRTGAPASGDLGRSGACFPLVGLGLGVALLAAQGGLLELFPPLLAATLVVAVWAALTGGLHLDGLADCADGLLATASRDRRLEILRDPRVGAFGVVGLTLFLLLKALAAAALLGVASAREERLVEWLHVAPLISSAVFARWVVLVVARQPSARPDGSAAGFARGLGLPVLCVAAVIPLVLIGVDVARGDWSVLIAAAVAHLVAIAIIALARARLGGVTGDVLGLTIETVELSVLLTFVARSELAR